MNYETIISILEDALCDRRSRDGQALMDVLSNQGFNVSCIDDRILSITHTGGHLVYSARLMSAEDFYCNLHHRMQDRIKAAFRATGARGIKVIVGKARLLPFPDKQLTPAPAP